LKKICCAFSALFEKRIRGRHTAKKKGRAKIEASDHMASTFDGSMELWKQKHAGV
jgi:hypothetical protein